MKLKTYHKNSIFLLLIITLVSCSTKKKTWVNRTYHNTTAKYNGYFNGNESIKLGVKKLHESHKDDYTTILPVYPTGDLKKAKTTYSYMNKAIKKGSIVIQRHSMKIKGKEYCKWIDDNYLMVGKSYFYKGEFDEAIKTFNFIKNEYKKNEIRFNASLWLVRSYVEKKDFRTAESELEELLKNKRFPEKMEKELAVVASDFYVQKQDYRKAIQELKNATSKIKRKRKKVRYNYILAQIYQDLENYTLAQDHYELVLKASPEYEMIFNAKMNLARSLQTGNRDTEKMKKELLRMTKDDKNKEYLDQIYYTIAEMDLNAKDTLSATKNYLLSTVNSVENNTQKAISFLALGKIDFEKKRYKSAKVYYDSTIFYMNTDFRLFLETEVRQIILAELVTNLEVIEMQDSLQDLAKLPKPAKDAIIYSIIQAEIEKEREEAENERIRQTRMLESGRNRGRNEQFGNNTSGGKWYFYNPATLSFGMSDFRKKWGKRKLEDDWRRRDKKTSNNFETEVITTDSSSTETQNTKDPNYYLDQLPKSDEDFEASDAQIKEALYQLGGIYKEKLKEKKKSTASFYEIYSRFPEDFEFSPLALYNVYANYFEEENINKAEETKNILINKYPSSIHAKLLTNPNYTSNELSASQLAEIEYKKIYFSYKNADYQNVIRNTKTVQEDKYKNRYLFIRALALIRIKNTEKAEQILTQLSLEEDEISQEAKYILEAINDPSKMKKANELAFAGSPYLYRSNKKHMIIVVLPKEGADVTYIKTLISDFNTNSIGNEVFEISALLLGLDKHLLMIQSFKDVKESMLYYDLFIEEKKIINALNKKQHKIMSISFENFEEFYKNKDVQGYHKFFLKNYFMSN